MLCLTSCVEVVFLGERSCVFLVVFIQILSGGALCRKSCVDVIVEILLCEGGDVELGARTSEHILVFAFDLLSLNPLSLFVLCIILSIISYLLVLCLASFILLYIHYMLGLCLCASLVLNHKSFI